MERYRNINGHSNIAAYEVGEDYIIVQFADGATYLYDSLIPGRADVEMMKELAAAGHGLASYIHFVVRQRYARRLR